MPSETGPTNVEGVKRVKHAELRRGRKRDNEKDKRRNVKSTRKRAVSVKDNIIMSTLYPNQCPFIGNIVGVAFNVLQPVHRNKSIDFVCLLTYYQAIVFV